MPSRQLDLEALLASAVEIVEANQREAYMVEACEGDTQCLEQLRSMVHDYFAAGSLIDRPAVLPSTHAAERQARLGAQIGPYTLREPLGEGGMGSVYVAEQQEPVRRKVALKVIKPGMDTRQVIARFEAEWQALALMDHPNIAKVFDAGATEAGRPYFVMELVKGKPITEYCDCEQLSMRDRLELFVALCHGVQHAHQKGVIHRDLKPSNTLVEIHDVRPVPKIIDFGVAKAMGQHLTELTLHTGFDQMVGTPLYMSPEQAGLSSVDVDTRSDIYSLGVLLYELLTGHTPFEKDMLRTAGADELRRIIREVDPPRPSARVSTLAAAELTTISDRRHVDSRRLRQQLQGDLDWIVMKALNKDRTRRYESASALAADVQRYLADEPIQARPPSLTHHAAKWVRRHRPLVWSTSVVLMLAALVGSVLLWTGYRRAAQLQQDVGEHLAAATAFFGSGDYHAADRKLAEARGRLVAAGYRVGPLEEQVTALTADIAAKTRAMDDFGEFQNLRHRIHSEMYALDRDILDQAQTHCRAALELFGVLQADRFESRPAYQNLDAERQAMLVDGAVELLFILARLEMDESDALAPAERSTGYLAAIQVLRKIESIHPGIPAVPLWTAECFDAMGEQQASAEARTQAESLQPTSATDHYLLGEYRARHGQQDEALASYWQALARQPDHYLALLAAGVVLGELQEHESAEAMLTGAIALNPQTVIAYLKRATSRAAQRKVVLAQADVEEAQKRDPELASALLRRATEYRLNFQFSKALVDFRDAARLDPTPAAYAGSSETLLLQGDLDKALADCNEWIRREPESAAAYCMRAENYRLKGELDKALADANEAIRLDPQNPWGYLRRGLIYENKLERNTALADMNEAIRLDPKGASFFCGRAALYLQLGEWDKALPDCQESIRLDPKHVWAYPGLVRCYQKKGELDKALAAADEAVLIAPEYSLAYTSRAAVHRARGDFAKALADYNEAVHLAPQFADVYSLRAEFHNDRRDFEKALADCQEALRLDPKHMRALGCLVNCYREKGELDKAFAAADQAVHIAPEYCFAHTSRATIYSAKRDFDRALADANEAVRLSPGDAVVYLLRGQILVDKGDLDGALADFAESIRIRPHPATYHWRAIAYRHKGQFELAMIENNAAIPLDPQNPWSYYDRARTYLCLDEPDKALAGASEAIRIEPNNDDWYVRRGEIYLGLRRFDKAAADFDRAAELAPLSWHHYKRLALVHFELKHYDQALESISKAVELNPGDGSNLTSILPARVAKCPDERLRQGLLELADKAIETTNGDTGIYMARAGLHDAFGRHDEALADFEKALELQPDSVGVCNNLAWYLATCSDPGVRQPDRAVELATKATQRAPCDSPSWNTLGVAQYRAGDYKAAVEALTKSMQLRSGGDAFDWFFAAMAHWRLDHKDEARQWYDKSIVWMETNKPDDKDLIRFRAEASVLLGIVAN